MQDEGDAGRLAVVNLTNNKTMRRAQPLSGGANDLRMGSMDRRLLCGTCENGNDAPSTGDAGGGLCIGHFGQVALVCAAFNPLTLAFGIALLR